MPIWKRQSIVWLFVGPVLPDDEEPEQGENMGSEQVGAVAQVYELVWAEGFELVVV